VVIHLPLPPGGGGWGDSYALRPRKSSGGSGLDQPHDWLGFTSRACRHFQVITLYQERAGLANCERIWRSLYSRPQPSLLPDFAFSDILIRFNSGIIRDNLVCLVCFGFLLS